MRFRRFGEGCGDLRVWGDVTDSLSLSDESSTTGLDLLLPLDIGARLGSGLESFTPPTLVSICFRFFVELRPVGVRCVKLSFCFRLRVAFALPWFPAFPESCRMSQVSPFLQP